MELYDRQRIKWTYSTHRVDRAQVAGIAPTSPEADPGALVLARIVQIGRHKEVEAPNGRKMMLFPGDIVAGTLAHRYATDQFEGFAAASGPTGHLMGVGGIFGEVRSKNERMIDPTVVEWIGRLADSTGHPLNLRRFALHPRPSKNASRPRTAVVVGASMNAGKTTTAAQIIRSLSGQGSRVSAAKITGTACRKDPGMFEDAGAHKVLDFTHFGFPSTAHLPERDLLGLAAGLRAALLEDEPETIVYEIADGIFQRETRLLLEDPDFHATVDTILYAAPESPSCESGVRWLRERDYTVVGVAGPVANSHLGMAEVEEATGVPAFNGEMILAGALDRALRPASVA
jgi:hypothetical protein